jgi:hypothetical protein
MPSLEQIIRPFVVDPTTPPVPVITTSNDPAPDAVRLNIGIGATLPQNLSSNVAPILPPTPLPPTRAQAPTITSKTLSSSFSMSVTDYMTGVVKEKKSSAFTDPLGLSGFKTGPI